MGGKVIFMWQNYRDRFSASRGAGKRRVIPAWHLHGSTLIGFREDSPAAITHQRLSTTADIRNLTAFGQLWPKAHAVTFPPQLQQITFPSKLQRLYHLLNRETYRSAFRPWRLEGDPLAAS